MSNKAKREEEILNTLDFFRSKRQKHFVNLAPLIDVVFILLAFLLVYSRIDNSKSIEVELPQLQGEIRSQSKYSTISIKKNGEIYLDNTLFHISDIEKIIENINTDASIQIKSDKNAPAELLIAIMQSLSKQNKHAVEILVDESN